MTLLKRCFHLSLPLLLLLSVSAHAADFDRKELHENRLRGLDRRGDISVSIRGESGLLAAGDGTDILLSESIAPARFVQDQGSLVHLKDGGWLAVWSDARRGSKKIYGQRLDSSGEPIGSNTALAGSLVGADFVDPVVAQDTLGRIYLLYRDQTDGLIFARRYLADMTPDLGPFVVNDTSSGSFAGPFDFDIYPNGRMVVVWEAYAPTGSWIASRVYNSLGNSVAGPSVVNTDGGMNHHWVPSVAVRPDAGYLVCWEDYRNGTADIFARLFNGNGDPLGGEFAIVPPPPDTAEQYAPQVVYSPLYSYVIGWLDRRSAQEVYLQRYSSVTGLIGGNLLISGPDSLTTNWDLDLTLSVDNTLLATWASFGPANEVRFERFDASLNALGGPRALNASTLGQRWGPVAEFASIDGFGLAWTERQDADGDISFGIFDTTGQRVLAEELLVNDDATGAPSTEPDIAWSSDFWDLVVFTDERSDAGDIFVQSLSNVGEAAGANRRVNQDAGVDRQSRPSLATSENAAIVVWLDNRQLNGISGQRIYGRFVDIWGGFATGEMRLSDSGQAAVKAEPCAAISNTGRTLVVWVDRRGGSPQIYGQWLSADHQIDGSNFAVSNSSVDLDNDNLYAGSDEFGRFYVVWLDRGQTEPAVRCTWYMADGAGGGSFTWVSPLAGVSIEEIAAAVHGDGLVSLLWSGYDSDTRKLYLTQVDKNGTELISNREVADDPTSEAEQIDLAVDESGYHSTVWIDHRDGIRLAYYQIFDDNLVPVGPNTAVSSAAPEFMKSPSVSAHHGRLWITWSDPRQDGLNIYGTTNVYLPTDVGGGDDPKLPRFFQLSQNYPNPFNPSTTIQFSLPSASHVRLTVYNLLGRQVRELADAYFSAGSHEVVWDGTDESGQTAATGIYLYRMTAGDFVEQRKMLLIK